MTTSFSEPTVNSDEFKTLVEHLMSMNNHPQTNTIATVRIEPDTVNTTVYLYYNPNPIRTTLMWGVSERDGGTGKELRTSLSWFTLDNKLSETLVWDIANWRGNSHSVLMTIIADDIRRKISSTAPDKMYSDITYLFEQLKHL